jgi:hypothetical protein
MSARASDGRSMTDACRALPIHSRCAFLMLLSNQRAASKLGISSSPHITRVGAVILAARQPVGQLAPTLAG